MRGRHWLRAEASEHLLHQVNHQMRRSRSLRRLEPTTMMSATGLQTANEVPTSSLIAKRLLFAVGRHRYATNAMSKRYTKLSHPSRMNHLVFQCPGTNPGSLLPAKLKELRKKKPKITMILPSIHHHNLLYIVALTFCFLSNRSLIVA